ncbi:hypothetical protein CsSME_00026216 [Camellia sinensis var. sinensis]|uniref:Uncharacterized protein n=1 Tax=Camellia sinensis var. sinensis TaxID=542762 RepID=A0A4S4CW21_CAMSN|nr:hypothetical protein TEA_018414 [Camellia sinensis var. sinensis]
MQEIRSNFNIPTETGPKTTSPHPQPLTFPPTTQKTMHKSNTITTTIPEKRAAKTPVEIGTRGTVGSLMMKEIEYFNRLELGSQDSSEKPRHQFTDMASTSSYSRPPKHGSLIKTPKKKKKGGSKLVPNICSMVEVAENNQPNKTSGFSYRNLKADAKKLQLA